MSDHRASQAFEKSLSLKTMEMKSKTRGGGRCCICFDPFSIQNVSVIVFFCCHGYHTTCLTDSYYTSSTREIEPTPKEAESYDDYNGYADDASDENEEETKSDGPRMRCILCTTAAG
jgi:vacuolar protein sorting-associated protein 41